MPVIANTITPLKHKVLVHNIEEGSRRTHGGVILLDDNGKEVGIRERWSQVYALGPGVDDLAIGDWILLKHGRWSRGINIEIGGTFTTIRQVDYPDAILLVSKECPIDR